MKLTLLSSLFRHRVPRYLVLPFCIFLCGLLFSLHLDRVYQAERQAQIEEALARRVEQISEGVSARVTLYSQGISSIKAAITANDPDNINYTFFERYSHSQDYKKQYPGARGFGFIRFVESDNMPAFIAMAQRDRPDSTFQVKTLSSHEQSAFVIQYIMPEGDNRQAIGLDIGSEAMRRNAAVKAARTNSVQLTAPLTLVQADKQVLHGFLILQPIFRENASELVNVKSENLVGWSYAPLLIEDILKSISGLKSDVQLTIEDVTADVPQPFFTTEVKDVLPDFSRDITLALFGRKWLLTLQPDNTFLQRLPLPPRHQAFRNTMAVTLSLMLIAFCVQLIATRRDEAKVYERKLAKANQQALTINNQRLEQEVKARTQAMTKAMALQNSILEGAGYSLIATDEAGLITVFNPAAEKLLGYSAAEMVGKLTPAHFHLAEEVVDYAQILSKQAGIHIEPGFEAFVAKARCGETDTRQWTYVRKDGRHIPVRLSVTALTDENEQLFGFLGIAYDLTPQLEREQELKQAKEQAEKANEAKSQFLANMSHEIRTPMNGVYGALQLLRLSVREAKEQHLLDNAIYSAKTLTTIINDILDFSKIEAGKLVIDPHQFVLSSLLDSLYSDLTIMLGSKPIELALENTATHDVWIGDAVRIRQILLNIGSNAIKFTQQGKVSVEVKQTNDHTIKFIVTDSGIGMSETALSSLFNRFEQADSTTTRIYGGTGLGMAITHSLVKLMQGDIKVVSTPNRGTKFVVSLPLEQSQQQPLTASDFDNPDAPAVQDGKILIAEDNEINRTIINAILENSPFTLFFAEDGVQAVEMANSLKPNLILMDIQMPNMDGIEACKRIKTDFPDLPIIALTANAMAKDIALYKAVGFDDYLAKPVEIKELHKGILRHIRSEACGIAANTGID